MSKKIISTDQAPRPVGPYSQAVQSGGILYLSGQIPINPQTGNLVLDSFEAQCRQVLDNAKAVLKAGNSSLAQVLKVSIFLTDLARFEEFNRIYSEYFDQSKPARSCVQAAALPKGVDVEIEMIAISGEESA